MVKENRNNISIMGIKLNFKNKAFDVLLDVVDVYDFNKILIRWHGEFQQ